jgi:anti-sigma factor RsiW
MTKHYSEADLLETYYMMPDQTVPVMQHLRTCDECIARYNRLEEKLRAAAACPTKPATFWAFQRGSVMRKVDAQRREASGSPRTWRVAAAAILAFFLGGAVVYETVKPAPKPVAEAATATQAQAPKTPESLTADPWQNDELQDFHAVVQWESWVPEGKDKKL